MKKLLAFILLALAVNLHAQTTTISLTITNGVTNGMTITVNGTQRYFTNVVTSTANQILTNTTVIGVQSNVYNAYALAPQTGYSMVEVSTNQINWVSYPGFALTASLTGAWGTLATNSSTPTNLFAVRVPTNGTAVTVISPYERTNSENGLVGLLNDNAGTLSVATDAPPFVNYVSVGPQTLSIAGAKTFTGTVSGTVGSLSNGAWSNPSLTNGSNFGLPFRSPGAGTASEQFGTLASASTNYATAFGYNAKALAVGATALGNSAKATNIYATAVGTSSLAGNNGATALGEAAVATGTVSLAVGYNSFAPDANGISIGPNANGNSGGGFQSPTAIGYMSEAANNYSTALGQQATTTADHQVMLGTASETVVAPGPSSFVGNVLSNFTTVGNVTLDGTNVFAGVVAFSTTNVTTLANGGNQDVPLGTNETLILSGPTGAFTIYGIVSTGINDQEVSLFNNTGYSMTLANNSGSEATAGNRINILTGQTSTGDTVFTNYPAVVTLRYSTALSRWIIWSHN